MTIPGLHSAIGGATDRPFTIEYLGAIEHTGTESQINGAIDIGAADPSKEIFVVMAVTFSADRTLGASTVAGVTVTKFTDEFSSADDRATGCFVALPTQAGSQTVDMNFSGALGSGCAFVFKVLNRPGVGTNNTDSDGDAPAGATGNSITLDQTTIAANGIWLAVGIENSTNTVSWNNGSITDQKDVELSNRAWCAHRTPQSASSTPSDVVSWTGNALRSGASWAFS